MPLSLDGFEVLKRMADSQELFEHLKADTADAAERLLRKTLTASSTDLNAFRELVHVIGEENIELVLQTMDVADVRLLLERIQPDRTHPGARKHTTATRRLLKVALERTEPAQPKPYTSLRSVLPAVKFAPFATLSMAPKVDD